LGAKCLRVIVPFFWDSSNKFTSAIEEDLLKLVGEFHGHLDLRHSLSSHGRSYVSLVDNGTLAAKVEELEKKYPNAFFFLRES